MAARNGCHMFLKVDLNFNLGSQCVAVCDNVLILKRDDFHFKLFVSFHGNFPLSDYLTGSAVFHDRVIVIVQCAHCVLCIIVELKAISYLGNNE